MKKNIYNVVDKAEEKQAAGENKKKYHFRSSNNTSFFKWKKDNRKQKYEKKAENKQAQTHWTSSLYGRPRKSHAHQY